MPVEHMRGPGCCSNTTLILVDTLGERQYTNSMTVETVNKKLRRYKMILELVRTLIPIAVLIIQIVILVKLI